MKLNTLMAIAAAAMMSTGAMAQETQTAMPTTAPTLADNTVIYVGAGVNLHEHHDEKPALNLSIFSPIGEWENTSWLLNSEIQFAGKDWLSYNERLNVLFPKIQWFIPKMWAGVGYLNTDAASGFYGSIGTGFMMDDFLDVYAGWKFGGVGGLMAGVSFPIAPHMVVQAKFDHLTKDKDASSVTTLGGTGTTTGSIGSLPTQNASQNVNEDRAAIYLNYAF